jgi:hypothetical protein
MTSASDTLIRLPPTDTKLTYLGGFWKWVERLAADDYQSALDGLAWSQGTTWTAASLKERVTTFFGGPSAWTVVVPNGRLVAQINDAADYAPQNRDGWGWFMAQIPLTTEPSNPKDDQIPLMGLATSFFVRPRDGYYVLELEIFHL